MTTDDQIRDAAKFIAAHIHKRGYGGIARLRYPGRKDPRGDLRAWCRACRRPEPAIPRFHGAGLREGRQDDRQRANHPRRYIRSLVSGTSCGYVRDCAGTVSAALYKNITANF